MRIFSSIQNRERGRWFLVLILGFSYLIAFQYSELFPAFTELFHWALIKAILINWAKYVPIGLFF